MAGVGYAEAASNCNAFGVAAHPDRVRRKGHRQGQIGGSVPQGILSETESLLLR